MTSPSPICTVNGGSTPADVAISSTVNGALASTAGAQFWSLTCTDTDETTTIGSITASLTVNQSTKTFQFTAPGSLGAAVQFTSTVGVMGPGLDANGIKQPSFTTTFKVNVRASNGLAVLTANETFEQNATFGWIASVNAGIRGASGGGGGGTGGQFNITLANGVNTNVSTGGLLVGLIGGPTAAFSISGISSSAASKAGLPLVLINTTAFQMTILHEDTGSTSGNRIRCLTGNAQSLVVKPFGGSVTLYYDNSVSTRWYAVSRGWEKQSPDHVDVREFGATANPSLNGAQSLTNRQNIQAAIDYAIANNIGTVLLPQDPQFPTSTQYLCGGGLFVYGTLRLTGEPRSNANTYMGIRTDQAANGLSCKSLYVGTNPIAPTLVVESGDTLMTMGPATYNGLQPPFVNLSENNDYGAAPIINGLSAFTFEVLLDANNVSSGTPTTWVIASSAGGIDTATQATLSFMLYFNPAGGNQIAGYLNTGSGPVLFVSSTTLPTSGKTILAVTYDGAHVSLYQGSPGGTATRGVFAAQTGAISQQFFEDFCLGCESSAPGVSGVASDSHGPWLLGWWRVSNSVRYTGATPTLPATPPTQDINTLSLCRGFDAGNTVRSGFLQGYVSNALYTWYRIHGTLGASYINNVEIDHLAMTSGITAWLTLNSHLHHLTAEQIDLDMFSYLSNVDHCVLNKATKGSAWDWSLAVLNGCAFVTVSHIQYSSGSWGVVSVYGGTFTNLWGINYPGNGGTSAFYYFGGVSDAPVVCIDCEAVDDTGFSLGRCGVLMYNQDNVEFNGAVYPSEFSSVPVFELDTNKEIRLSGEVATGNSSTPIIKFTNTNTIPVRTSLTQLLGTNRPMVDTAHPGIIQTAKSVSGVSTLNFTSNADMVIGTMTGTAVNDFFARRLRITDSGVLLTVPRNVVIPYALAGYPFVADNATAQTLTFKTPSGTGIAVAAGKRAWLEPDGTNVIRESADAS